MSRLTAEHGDSLGIVASSLLAHSHIRQRNYLVLCLLVSYSIEITSYPNYTHKHGYYNYTRYYTTITMPAYVNSIIETRD